MEVNGLRVALGISQNLSPLNWSPNKAIVDKITENHVRFEAIPRRQ